MEEFNTTFWLDFSIADRFGLEAVKDTFHRAFGEWKGHYKYLTALVVVLNHKIWQHWEAGRMDYAELYDGLWRQADAYANETLTGQEAYYYWRVTD